MTGISGNGQPMVVIGVIPDIQMESPFRPISPLTIIFNKDWVGCVDVRINPNMSASKAISIMKPIFDKYNPSFPFEYQFADEQYGKKFNYEELVGNLAAIMAVLARSTSSDFAFLRQHLGVSDSDLSKQAAALEASGYITITKSGRGRGAVTAYKATKTGRHAYRQHRAALRGLMGD